MILSTGALSVASAPFPQQLRGRSRRTRPPISIYGWNERRLRRRSTEHHAAFSEQKLWKPFWTPVAREPCFFCQVSCLYCVYDMLSLYVCMYIYIYIRCICIYIYKICILSLLIGTTCFNICPWSIVVGIAGKRTPIYIHQFHWYMDGSWNRATLCSYHDEFNGHI